MSGGLSIGTLLEYLPAAHAGIVAALTGTPTTTELPLDTLLQNNTAYVNGLVVLPPGYNGGSTPRTVTTITSTTTVSGVTVLVVPALADAPLVGMPVMLYPGTAGLAEAVSISAVGGTAVPSIGGVYSAPVTESPGNTPVSGSNTDVTDTAAAIVASSTTAITWFVQADPANTENVQVGSSTSQDVVLQPGQGISIPVLNLANIYAKAVSGTQTLHYLGVSS